MVNRADTLKYLMSATQTLCRLTVPDRNRQRSKRVYLLDILCADGAPSLSVIDRDDINKRFGRRLAQYRKRAGVSQEKLADALHLTRTSITNIEHGRQPIQLPTLYAIAEALQIEPQVLMPASTKVTVETPIDGEQLKGLSVKTTTWLASLSSNLPGKPTEAKDGSES